MSFPIEPSDHFPDDMARIEERLRESMSGVERIDALLRHLIEAGGKRLRPALTLFAAYAITGPDGRRVSDRVIDAAASVELLHIGSLYHDDVMDEADQRRGVESANHRWGNVCAILAGDHLLARSAQLTSALGQAEAAIMADTLAALCEGQLNESLSMFDGERSVAGYLESIAGKTAALLETSCQLGALEAGGSAETVDALQAFGHGLGMAFQLVDDVLDIAGDGAVTGKPTNLDLVEGVYTLPVLLAIEQDPDLLAPFDVDRPRAQAAAVIRDAVLATDAVRATVRLATEYCTTALARLDGAGIDPTMRTSFHDVVELVLRQAPAVVSDDVVADDGLAGRPQATA